MLAIRLQFSFYVGRLSGTAVIWQNKLGDCVDSLKIILSNLMDEKFPQFWETFEFWIFIILAVLSVFASFKAFFEAKKAKKAATEAGKTVKLQTITIELSEIVQKLDILDVDIDFSSARNFLNEINRRVRRLLSPYQEDDDYKEQIIQIREILADAKKSLGEVRPIESEGKEPIAQAVYYATESYFSELSGMIAELLGLFEKRTLESGVKNDSN